MTTPLYIDNYNLRFNTNLMGLEYNSGNEVWLPVPVPSGDIGLANDKIFVGNASNLANPVSMSGDATIANTGVLTLKNSGVTAASYTLSSITVDAQGRVTAASSGSAPTLGSLTLASMDTVVGDATNHASATAILRIDTTHTSVGINHTPPTSNYDLQVNGAIRTELDISAARDGRFDSGTVFAGSLNVAQNATFTWVPILPVTSATGGAISGASAALQSLFIVTVNAACTISAPGAGSGFPHDGQKIVYRIINDATHSVTFTTTAGNFRFGTTIPSYTNSVSLTDYVGAIWNAADGFWDIVSVSQGF